MTTLAKSWRSVDLVSHVSLSPPAVPLWVVAGWAWEHTTGAADAQLTTENWEVRVYPVVSLCAAVTTRYSKRETERDAYRPQPVTHDELLEAGYHAQDAPRVETEVLVFGTLEDTPGVWRVEDLDPDAHELVDKVTDEVQARVRAEALTHVAARRAREARLESSAGGATP